MPTTHSEYKVYGGKLIRVSLTVEAGVIVDLKITGDFFMHPEESIVGLEAHLRGLTVDAASLSEHIEDYLKRNRVEMLGASSKDFATAILRALDKLR